MCMEDIRIARKTWVRQQFVGLTVGQAFTLPADIKRVGVLFQQPSSTKTLVVCAGPDQNFSRMTMLLITAYNPVLRIEQWGQLIVGPLTVADSAGAAINFGCFEFILNDE